MVDKLKLALIVIVVALCAALWYNVRAAGALAARAETAEKALQRAQEQRKTDARVVAAAQAEKRSTGLQIDRQAAAVSEASRGSESWAGTSVPPDVQEALHGALEGLQ